jgi:hypothetical protein
MEQVIQSLERLEASIRTAQKEFDALGGQLVVLEKRLKEEFGVATIEEAKKLIEKEEREAKKEEEKIMEAFSKLKETYEW